MAETRDFPPLTGAPALPSGGAASGAEIERAAELVADFSGHSARPALDALLEAAEQPDRRAAAENLSRKAQKITRQSSLLFQEVKRFLTVK